MPYYSPFIEICILYSQNPLTVLFLLRFLCIVDITRRVSLPNFCANLSIEPEKLSISFASSFPYELTLVPCLTTVSLYSKVG